MPRCYLTYTEIPEGGLYQESALKKLSPYLKELKPLGCNSAQLRSESAKRAIKMSIAGVQPKVSARLQPGQSSFVIVDLRGQYILKPQVETWSQVPENEDLTMHLAELVGIETPVHGLIPDSEGNPVYFIKRFDRYGKSKKRAVEDFAQLSGHSRETKYNSSVERVIGIIEKFTTFPVIEKKKFFRRFIFNYLVGNEDMHLKNYSVISREGKIELSPAYDLLNSTIVLKTPSEESALPLQGKKKNLTRKILVSYLAEEKLLLPASVIHKELEVFEKVNPTWKDFIARSFLMDELKDKYLNLIENRCKTLDII